MLSEKKHSHNPFISIDKVSKTYGPIVAVSDISFNLKAGEILGLVGSDGAGKTTLLRMIATMMRPTTG